MKLLDLTHTICPAVMAYPGTAPAQLTVANTIAADGFQETLLHMYSHTGTHMDAPAHMRPDAAFLDQLPVDAFYGQAYVLDCTALGAGGVVTAEMLRDIPALGAADFLLLSSGWEEYWNEPTYFGDFPVLSAAAAAYLATLGLKGVGADMMSVDRMDTVDYPVHHKLFAQGMVVIENLCNLAPLRGRTVAFAALPLKYQNADGAPVRAVAFL